MKRIYITLLLTICCLNSAPLFAQPQIGGNTCNSATLTGAYAFSLIGRQTGSSGNLSNVFQGNGSATFDGLSKVTISMTTETAQAIATPVTWSGTYTVQSNCFGGITITSGGSATLVLLAYDLGTSFLATGNDANYAYSNGQGNNQPANCSASTLSGVYMFTGTGYNLTGSSVTGAENGTGLLQFDGLSTVTVNVNLSGVGNASATTLTGTYSVASGCTGSATLTDVKANSYTMTFSVTNATAVNNADFYFTLAENGALLLSGAGHAVYGQPSPATAALQTDHGPHTEAMAKTPSPADYGWRQGGDNE